MTIDFCALCNDPCLNNGVIGSQNQQELWRTVVAQALCAIAGSSLVGGEAVVLTQKAFTAANLTASFSTYADTTLLDSTKKLRRIRVINNTDSDLDFSLDGGATTKFRVIAGTIYDLEIGNFTAVATTSVQMKRSSGMTATTGSVYIEGSY
jgi:hypothetical protein